MMYSCPEMILTVDASDEEMDEFNRELEDFKRLCFMAKPLENRPKVALKVTLMGVSPNTP